jgi:large subunit ribosomal protein L16
MLMPKKVKYRKQQKGRVRGMATRGNRVNFGDYGLQVVERGHVTARQLEAGRIAIVRQIKKGGRMWIRIFPDKPITKKPQETRMGKGKGNVEGWVAPVKPGRIIYELEGLTHTEAQHALAMAAHKMSVATRIVAREDLEVL